MRKFTIKHGNSGFIHNLGLTAETSRKQNANRKSDSGSGEKCFKCKPSDQLKMETHTKDVDLSVNQNPLAAENGGNGQKESKPEETSKFILDYIPLCCEEDLELIAFYFAQDKEKKSS